MLAVSCVIVHIPKGLNTCLQNHGLKSLVLNFTKGWSHLYPEWTSGTLLARASNVECFSVGMQDSGHCSVFGHTYVYDQSVLFIVGLHCLVHLGLTLTGLGLSTQLEWRVPKTTCRCSGYWTTQSRNFPDSQQSVFKQSANCAVRGFPEERHIDWYRSSSNSCYVIQVLVCWDGRPHHIHMFPPMIHRPTSQTLLPSSGHQYVALYHA